MSVAKGFMIGVGFVGALVVLAVASVVGLLALMYWSGPVSV